jgi:hypothetical protein
MANHDLSGPYARDDHDEGLGDDYARDGGWSGAGRADNYTRDVHPPRTSIDATDVEKAEMPGD